MSDKKQKDEILAKAQGWFRDVLAQNHIKNTAKLKKPSEFNINPFLVTYLANFLTGNSSPESIAKALIYPRVLGQSITTSFGQNLQRFTNDVLGSFGSTTSGIDIEFIDQIDQQKKYCQLKAGPNTINKDDVETINSHFKSIRNLARTNNLAITVNDLIVGILYGERAQLSGHYKAIENNHHYPVIIGMDFWHRLTGDENFYLELIQAFAEVANEADSSKLLQDTIKQLAMSEDIQKLSSVS
jgi:hypothetical protein